MIKPKINERVLLRVQIKYNNGIEKYWIEGFLGQDYDTGDYKWYNWIGDEFESEEEVIGWMPLSEEL